MSTTLYSTSRWRSLPRTRCAAAELLGGECAGPIHRHHLHPLSLDGDPEGETVEVCARHHPYLEVLARKMHGLPRWRRCPHPHRTLQARMECEARLNRAA